MNLRRIVTYLKCKRNQGLASCVEIAPIILVNKIVLNSSMHKVKELHVQSRKTNSDWSWGRKVSQWKWWWWVGSSFKTGYSAAFILFNLHHQYFLSTVLCRETAGQHRFGSDKSPSLPGRMMCLRSKTPVELYPISPIFDHFVYSLSSIRKHQPNQNEYTQWTGN